MLIKKVTEIPIDLIFANPEQPRKIFGEEELLELCYTTDYFEKKQ